MKDLGGQTKPWQAKPNLDGLNQTPEQVKASGGQTKPWQAKTNLDRPNQTFANDEKPSGSQTKPWQAKPNLDGPNQTPSRLSQTSGRPNSVWYSVWCFQFPPLPFTVYIYLYIYIHQARQIWTWRILHNNIPGLQAASSLWQNHIFHYKAASSFNATQSSSLWQLWWITVMVESTFF